MTRFKHWLREFLGINDLARNQQAMYSDLASLHNKISPLRSSINAITPAISRLVAKIDPHSTRNPLDPSMKAESDVITEREIERIRREDAAAREAQRILEAEQAVRDQYGYTPKSE